MSAIAQSPLSLDPPPRAGSPRVSVVIPTRGWERYLSAAIYSALWQTYQDLEVLVVDDGRDDLTREDVEAIDDPRVVYLREENSGSTAARNAGVAAARGELIALLDADHVYQADFIETAIARLDASPDGDAVYTGYETMDESGQVLPFSSNRVVEPDALYHALLESDFLASCCVVARKSCYERCGGFDPAAGGCADWDLWLRFSRRCKMLGAEKKLVMRRVSADHSAADPSTRADDRLDVLNRRLSADRESDGRSKEAAYARAYLRATIEHLQHGDPESAQGPFERMAAMHPPLLEDPRIYIELAGVANAPGGGAFDAAGRRRAAEIPIIALDALFDWGGGPANCRRGAAYAAAHLAIARIFLDGGEPSEARKHLLAAARHKPTAMLREGCFFQLFETFVKPVGRS